jgi:hypothetical protein
MGYSEDILMRICDSCSLIWLAALAAVGIAIQYGGVAHAGQITGGAATMTFDILAINPFLTYTRFYGLLDNQAATLTAAQIQSGTVPIPSGSPSTPTTLLHPVNGTTVTDPAGRNRQTTTLDYDPNDVLGSWTASTNSGFVTSGGEQIGFDGVTMNAVDPLAGGGNFLWGDFALRRDPTRGGDGLVLVNNYGFGFNAFDLGVSSLSADASALTITGTLLLSPEWAGAFGGTAGSNVGSFSMVATVPEPGTMTLAGLGVAGGIVHWVVRRRARESARCEKA